jgi:ferrous iron transport protein B
VNPATVPLRTPLFRGERRLRIALVGLPGSGKTTLFEAVSSAAPQLGELDRQSYRVYRECRVKIGLDEASLVDLPGIASLEHLAGAGLGALKYLLWGDQRPPVLVHEAGAPPAPFAPPDLIIQVVDASRLQPSLELTLELSQSGASRGDGAQSHGRGLAQGPGHQRQGLAAPAGHSSGAHRGLMGQGLTQLFAAAAGAARSATCPLPPAPSRHIAASLEALSAALNREDVHAAFRVPHGWLLAQFAARDEFIETELAEHFATRLPELDRLRAAVDFALPRPLAEELHADRHHRAATLVESAMRMGPPGAQGWRYWLDEIFLHPHWGLIGSLAVFAAVLFVVFEISGWIDSMTTVKLAEAFADWQPGGTGGVVGRAVLDGLIGLTGIVVPYMIPLVMLLVSLEQAGLMQRIAFVVDRGFHRLGLHGGVALPFLLGLGCNVPAISGAARLTNGRERVIAAVLITFVPCSARSAIILAIAGKYLGVAGVIGMFALILVVIALAGHLLSRRQRELGPGRVQDIPPYSLPDLARLAARNLAPHQRHPDHRHAAAGGGQRGAGAARPCRRRGPHQHPAGAGDDVVAWLAGGPGRAPAVRRAAQGVVAADDLSGPGYAGTWRRAVPGPDVRPARLHQLLCALRIHLRRDAEDHRPARCRFFACPVDRHRLAGRGCPAAWRRGAGVDGGLTSFGRIDGLK